jgi:hypothetical protein
MSRVGAVINVVSPNVSSLSELHFGQRQFPVSFLWSEVRLGGEVSVSGLCFG